MLIFCNTGMWAWYLLWGQRAPLMWAVCDRRQIEPHASDCLVSKAELGQGCGEPEAVEPLPRLRFLHHLARMSHPSSCLSASVSIPFLLLKVNSLIFTFRCQPLPMGLPDRRYRTRYHLRPLTFTASGLLNRLSAPLGRLQSLPPSFASFTFSVAVGSVSCSAFKPGYPTVLVHPASLQAPSQSA